MEVGVAKRSRDEWRVLVERWRQSGQTRQSFARLAGVNASTLAWWTWKLRAEEPPGAFLDVVVEEPESAPDFQLEVSGIRVLVPLGFDAGELRRLVCALC
jgi:hypothetical protein